VGHERWLGGKFYLAELFSFLFYWVQRYYVKQKYKKGATKKYFHFLMAPLI